MNNAQIAKIFENIAELLELKGEDRFKIRAYQRAARTIDHSPLSAAQLVGEGRVRELPGIGKELAEKITEMVQTNDLEYYRRLKSEFPEGIVDIISVPGVGPKMAYRLWKELGVTTLEELEQAAENGSIASLPRMGQKTAENIIKHLHAEYRKDTRIPIGVILPIAEGIVASVSGLPGVKNVTPAGSLRRFRETVGDLDIIGTADDTESVIKAFTGLPQVEEIIAAGPQRASVRLHSGLQVDLRLVPHESYGSLLQHFTGSQAHNVVLREYAVKKGMSVSEYGITDAKSGGTIHFAEEESVYKHLGLQYIPPEIREGGEEVDAAERGDVPKLVELSDIRGDLHDHTNWSDGNSPLERMIEEARARGYEYVAITDHSTGRGVANGLSIERLREQIAIIRDLNEKYKDIRVLTGSEVDIRSDGSMDFPDDVLADLDIVIGSIHSAMGQDRNTMTQRIIRAIENPHVDIIGHLTTRLIGSRDPVSLDEEAIFCAAAASRTILEINASPSRLDLKDSHIYRARELGVILAISTDSHMPEQLDYMRYGVAQARRGWCQSHNIINTRSLRELLEFLKVGS